MSKINLRQYLLYLLRWQLSTPLLFCVIYFIDLPKFWQTVLANFIGGLIFFWVDRLIFMKKPPKTTSQAD